MRDSVEKLCYNKVSSVYMLRLSEFRNLYAKRHESGFMDSFGSERSNLFEAIRALKEVRIYRYLFGLVSADMGFKNL